MGKGQKIAVWAMLILMVAGTVAMFVSYLAR